MHWRDWKKKLHEFSWSNPCPWCQQPTVCFTTCLEVMECNMSLVMWLNQRHTVHGLQHTVISDVMMWLTGSSWSMHVWLQWQWNIAWWLCMFWFALLSWAQIYMHHMIMFFTWHTIILLYCCTSDKSQTCTNRQSIVKSWQKLQYV